MDSGPRLAPSDVVECETFAARISAACCVARHVARTPSGAGRGFPLQPACAVCEVGAARLVELRAVGFKPRKYPQVFNPGREAVHRAARDRLFRSGLLYREAIPDVDRPPAG